MGVFKSMPMKQILLWVFFINFFIFITPLLGDDDSRKTPTWNVDDPSPPPFTQESANFSPFKPSIAVIIGFLTTMFCITFLLLLYAKHCKRGNDVVYNNDTGLVLSTARKNSGVGRTVIEWLPIFRFGALRGQKDRLECAICLTRFEPTEILRLLPKCKHAFHVECVDTWLESHSTCPLCRYRVDAEDILLVEDAKFLHENQETESEPEVNPGFRRVSGRHSSAGELERGSCSCSRDPTAYRRSLDSARLLKKNESITVGCFDRHRKDGLLLTDGVLSDRKSFERRFGHRIIISAAGWSGSGFHQRWSDVFPSDLLYLRSEMIITDSHRLSSGASRQSATQQMLAQVQDNRIAIDGGRTNGSRVINSRSVSEITGLSRFSNGESDSIVNRNHRQQQQQQQQQQRQRQRQLGLVSRWMAWISSQSLPTVRSDRSTEHYLINN